MSLWGLIPQPPCLKLKWEKEKKEKYCGSDGIELGSPESEKCNYQVYYKIKCYSMDSKAGSIAKFCIDT